MGGSKGCAPRLGGAGSRALCSAGGKCYRLGLQGCLGSLGSLADGGGGYALQLHRAVRWAPQLPRASGQARLSGRARSHVQQLSGRGCRMGSATGTARWLCTQTRQNCRPSSLARQGPRPGFTDGQSRCLGSKVRHHSSRNSDAICRLTTMSSSLLLLFSISD